VAGLVTCNLFFFRVDSFFVLVFEFPENAGSSMAELPKTVLFLPLWGGPQDFIPRGTFSRFPLTGPRFFDGPRGGFAARRSPCRRCSPNLPRRVLFLCRCHHLTRLDIEIQALKPLSLG